MVCPDPHVDSDTYAVRVTKRHDIIPLTLAGDVLGNTQVEVTVDGGTVTVSDRGPGVPDGEHERIFDRFARHFHLTPSAEARREELRQFLDALDGQASKFEAKRAATLEREAARAP